MVVTNTTGAAELLKRRSWSPPPATPPARTRNSHTPGCRWRTLPGMPALTLLRVAQGSTALPRSDTALPAAELVWFRGPSGSRSRHLGIKSPLLFPMS